MIESEMSDQFNDPTSSLKTGRRNDGIAFHQTYIRISNDLAGLQKLHS